MEKDYKKIIEESKLSLEKAQEKIETLSADFSGEVSEFWDDMKKRFSTVNDKLKDAYKEYEGKSELQTHLSVMEAREKLEKIKESAENFVLTTSKKTNEEFSMATLKAKLAKMDADDKWEETKKELSHSYEKSKVEVENLATKAGQEIKEIFRKLTEMV